VQIALLSQSKTCSSKGFHPKPIPQYERGF